MPRVVKRKARKDYPSAGIKKGDEYYYTKLKLQRGGMVKRSLTPFKPSQLTNSPFKSGFLAAQEGWEASDKSGAAAEEAAEAIREVGNEAQNGFDAMPEGLQQGETGQQLENRASECERIADEIMEHVDALNEDEPDEFDPSDYAEETSAMDPEDVGEFLSEKEQDCEQAKVDWDEAIENAISEIDSLLGDMPE